MSPLVCIVILLFVPVRGIKLPGVCPSVPPTHTRKPLLNDLVPNIYFGLPFSEKHTSHLFKDINARTAPEFGVVLETSNIMDEVGGFDNALIAIKLIYQRRQYSLSDVTVDALNQTLILKSSVFDDPAAEETVAKWCHQTISENVRLWYDGCFVIIWSCINTPDHHHDEALLLLASVEPPHSRKTNFTYCEYTNSAMAHGLNQTSRKYVGDAVVDWVDWSKEPRLGPDTRPFECPAMNSFFQFRALLFYVVSLAILYSCFWGNPKSILLRFDNNRVMPYSN